MPHNETTRYDRYTLKAYCQHCHQYIVTIAGVERERLPSVRAQVRELAQEHADAAGRWIEVTYYTTLQRTAEVTPTGQPPSGS